MINSKYKVFDPTTNIIISTKVLGCQYIASSKVNRIKKIQPNINCQIFYHRNKNQRILSKNDRKDIFLNGGNFNNLKTIDKFCSQKAVSLKPSSSLQHRPNSNPIIFPMSSEPNEIKYIHRPNSKRLQFSRQIKSKSKLESIEPNQKPINQLKNKPLYYLEQKQINHISAESFIVSQFPSGQIILGNCYRKNGEIASLTKIMTFYCVHQISTQHHQNIEQEYIVIDEFVSEMTGTSAQLYEGDRYTVKQLLYGMMLPSGNDAATALAKWAGRIITHHEKPVKAFVSYMNTCAKDLKMKTTKFANPHGLSNSYGVSNAQQIALLIHQCLNIPLFRQVVSCRLFKCLVRNGERKREVVWENTNKLLRREGFIGVKTGVTVTAGPCFASCYQINNKIYITVLLRSKKLSRRFKETRMIIGIALSKINLGLYRKAIEKVMREDKELDSDNSEDEQEFNYDRNDGAEMIKRNIILAYQL